MAPASDTTAVPVYSPTDPGAPQGKEARKKRVPHAPAPRRFVATLYARATHEEKERIENKAAGAGLSVSRYLVRAAAEEKLPPSLEEKARLEGLLYHFKRASLFLDHLVANQVGLERAGATFAQQQEIREAARLLTLLATELKRRL